MKHIVITSSGFLRKPIRDELLKILPERRPLKVAYIPTASRVVKDDSYARKDVEILGKLGIHVDELDLAEVGGEALERRIRENDFLYVQGGNPYWLLKKMRESSFDVIALRLNDEGMLYIGKSAGGYILSPEVIVPSWFENTWRRFDVTDVTGMGVVPFLWKAHFAPEDKKMIEKIKIAMQQTQYPVRVITNDQGFWIRGDEVKFIGVGQEYELNS